MDAFNEAVASAASRNIDKYAAPAPDSDEAQNDELLIQPSAHAFTGVATHRPPRDVAFAVLYVCCMLAFIAVITAYIVKFIGLSADTWWYSLFFSCAGVFAFCFLLDTFVGAIWLLLFQSLTRMAVWLAAIGTPALMFFGGAITIINELRSRFQRQPCTGSPFDDFDCYPSVRYLALGGTLMGLAALMALFVYLFRARIHLSIRIFQLTCRVLRTYPQLLLIHIASALALLGFTAAWHYALLHIFIADYAKGSYAALTTGGGVLVAFLVLCYLWTASLLDHLARFVISGVTAHWYFHRTDIARNRRSVVGAFMVEALTSSFGSLCLAALVLAAASALRMLLDHVIRRVARWSRVLACCLSGVVHMLESIVRQVTVLSVARMAMTGEGFCASTGFVAGVLRRAGAANLSVGAVVHIVLACYRIAFATMSAVLVIITNLSLLKTGNAVWPSALFAFSVTYFVMRFYTGMIVAVADTLFLCYLTEAEVVNAPQGNNDLHEENTDVMVVFGDIMSARKQANVQDSVLLMPRSNDDDVAAV